MRNEDERAFQEGGGMLVREFLSEHRSSPLQFGNLLGARLARRSAGIAARACARSTDGGERERLGGREKTRARRARSVEALRRLFSKAPEDRPTASVAEGKSESKTTIRKDENE